LTNDCNKFIVSVQMVANASRIYAGPQASGWEPLT